MQRAMRGKIELAVFLFFALSNSAFSENDVTISQIQGLEPDRGLMTDYTVRFFVHMSVGGAGVYAIGNGFRVYSPDDAYWQPLYGMQVVMLSSYFDGYAAILSASLDGQGADSIGVGAFRILASGFPAGFDQDVFYIETRLTPDVIGKTLCLDSSKIGNVDWHWGTTAGTIKPNWDGPHCYEIVDCCVGNRGDVNGDGAGPNILDLDRLVGYLFRGAPAPNCALESDVNSDGTPFNIFDLIYIVDYMHRGGPAPGACP